MRGNFKILHFMLYILTDKSVVLTESKAYLYSVVNGYHSRVVQVTHFFFKSFLVNGAHLLEKNDAVLCKTDVHAL